MTAESWISRRMGRRQMLAGSAGALAAGLPIFSGCDLSTDPQSSDGDASGDGGERREAPSLAERVESGELPPLEERLPTNPVVVEPADRSGRYGGTWTCPTTGPSDAAWWWRTVGYEHLTRVRFEDAQIEPNLAESFDVSDDGTEFVFHLRDGIKWSDGEPFSAEDILFWWEDVQMNEDLYPAGPPSWITSGGQPAEVELIDELTIAFRFPGGPHGYFPYLLAAAEGRLPTSAPKHYLSQFHPDYNDQAEEMARAEGLESWMDLFARYAGMDDMSNAEGLPVVRPWMMATDVSADRLRWERNPYYWKADPDGRQLPYIDEVMFEVLSDPEVMLLKATNGEYNYVARHINFPDNKPVLSDSAEQGGYRLVPQRPSAMNVGVVALNLTHPDPVKREIFRNRDFRVGLSHAIDRQEIIDAVYQRQGEPWQAAPTADSRFHDEEMAKQYTEYDLDIANEYLDRAGYSERDSDGWRLGPDGARISIEFIASTSGGALEALLIDAQELMREHWAEVGIVCSTQPLERSLYQVRSENDDHDALMWTGYGGDDLTTIIDARWYVPIRLRQENYAAKWAQWYLSDGSGGEEPPDIVQEQLQLYRDVLAEVDDDKRDDIMREVIRIAKEEFHVFGLSTYPEGYSIVAANFHNVPPDQYESWPYAQPGQSRPEQYFIDDESAG